MCYILINFEIIILLDPESTENTYESNIHIPLKDQEEKGSNDII